MPMLPSHLFRRLRRDRPWLGLALGAGLFAIAGISRFFLGGLSEGFEPITLLPAMLLAGLVGGIRVGLGICFVCIIVAWVWFFPPYGTFILASHDAITMGMFILTAVLELCVIRVLNVTINDLALARERSNTLFRELQHRVANNIQFVAAILHLAKKEFEAGSAGAHALDAARSRLELMSRVHRRLHDPAAADLPLASYIEDLCRDLIQASASPHVELRVQAPPVRLDFELLMSLSLIVAELVTNSLKHAFLGRVDGRISIRFAVGKRNCTLSVADDGCGFPPGREVKPDSLGRTILQSLVSQLQGTVSFESDRGAVTRIVFPRPKGVPAYVEQGRPSDLVLPDRAATADRAHAESASGDLASTNRENGPYG
jgi:two-component sensor histidine kinase